MIARSAWGVVEGGSMRQCTHAPRRWFVVLTFAILALLLLVISATPSRANRKIAIFPPGYWCGVGKAPAGEIVPTPVKGAIGRGILYFFLARGVGGLSGFGSSIFTVHVEKLTGQIVTVTTLQADGTFPDMVGKASEPVLKGSWEITGEVKVRQGNRTFAHPLAVQTRKWQGTLVVERATRNVVSGHWIVPKWKWTARKRQRGGICPG
jgi:hypothetical protein